MMYNQKTGTAEKRIIIPDGIKTEWLIPVL
jgi:hypothetical protein